MNQNKKRLNPAIVLASLGLNIRGYRQVQYTFDFNFGGFENCFCSYVMEADYFEVKRRENNVCVKSGSLEDLICIVLKSKAKPLVSNKNINSARYIERLPRVLLGDDFDFYQYSPSEHDDLLFSRAIECADSLQMAVIQSVRLSA